MLLPIIRNLLFIVLLGIYSISCQSEKKLNSKTLPFELAKNYFVKNDATLPYDSIIKSELVFNQIFGMATTMGINGKPTFIDFNKKMVVPIILSETNFNTEIDVLSIYEKDKDELVVNYKIREHEKNSYTIIPFSAIIIDKRPLSKVIFDRKD